jgi:protein-S-isoprenylcysteine O-methyltransferase Ste14
MSAFDWVSAFIVIVTFVYLTFVTLVEWFAALRKGQAVTLLPERKGGVWPLWMQMAVIVAGIGLSIPLFYFLWIPIFVLSVSPAPALAVVGLIIYVGGTAFTLWARRTLGKNWGVSTSLQVKLRDHHNLVQNGPYAIVRHPMYFGVWVFMFGLLLLYPMWVMLILTVSMLASLYMRARREEVALAERFGNTWVEYKKQTKFIIPFIY